MAKEFTRNGERYQLLKWAQKSFANFKVVPLMFQADDSAASLGLDGSETYPIAGIDAMAPRRTLQVTATRSDGSQVTFDATARLDTEVDVDYFRQGGVLPYVLRKIMTD